jgi:hypothetical protein
MARQNLTKTNNSLETKICVMAVALSQNCECLVTMLLLYLVAAGVILQPKSAIAFGQYAITFHFSA